MRVDSASTQPASPAKFRPVLRKMSTSGRASRTRTVESLGEDLKSANSSAGSWARSDGTGTLTRLPMKSPNRYPHRYQVGTAMMRPQMRTSPTFAPRSPDAATGPGCGGTKMCMAEKAIAEGMA